VDTDASDPTDAGAGARVPTADSGSATIDDVPADGEGGRRRLLSPATRNLLEWVVVIGGAIIITVLLRTFAFQTFYIPSESMVPTLQVDDRIVVNKLSDDYHLGDIVVFRRPDSWNATHDVLIKRIMGLGGQTIEIRDNTVYLDGLAIEEPYLPDGVMMPDYPPFVIPDDDIFVMGDNRMFSSDSRENGPVPVDNVVGRAALRIWPLSEFGGL
jgi:signal peptidase I